MALTIAAFVAAVIATGAISHRSAARSREPPSPPPTALTVSNTPYGRRIAPGFVGLSFEYTALAPYAGTDPHAINPVLVQLIRNLAPGQSPVLRIGGDSTDWTWAPTPGLRRPPGVRFALTPGWLAVTHALAQAARARLILGINLEANQRALARAEVRSLINSVGRSAIAGLEIGNEPELYRSFAWYRNRAGRQVPGRPRGYNFHAFATEFSQFGARLPRLPLAGPAIGGQQWIHYTGPFVAAEPRLGLVTLHRYPLQRCHLPAASDLYPTIAHLLSGAASRGLASGVAPYVRIARAHGLPLRLDEINSVSCSGARGVSDTFASALWSLDTMFELARVGVDGVNIHTFPHAAYAPFSFSHAGGRWQATVAPEYYGLLMFTRAAPPGSRLLKLTGTPNQQLDAWATLAPDKRTRIVLVNDSTTRTRTVALRAASRIRGQATLTRLGAPAINATSGVSLGGQSFAPQTSTGQLTGPGRTATVPRSPHGYVVDVPPATAAMLTLPRSHK